MTSREIFLQQLLVQLEYKPNKHITQQVLSGLPDVPEFDGFFYAGNFSAQVDLFMQLPHARIERLLVKADIAFFDDAGRPLPDKLSDVSITLYRALQEGAVHPDDWLLLNMDDLLFYLNRYRNNEVIASLGFPELKSCELGGKGFNFITDGREFCNKYFLGYSGPVLDIYFENELRELFAIASNGLAALYRIRDRAVEELELSPNFRPGASLQLYPRFNNGISEVAGTIYACWERIAFLLTEFFPLNVHSQMAPSFKQYVTAKEKESLADSRLQNAHLDWFKTRIDGQHLQLEELRHPTVHYNKFRNPAGTRAVELMKHTMDTAVVAETVAAWNDELDFLKGELGEFDRGIQEAILMMEKWALVLRLTVSVSAQEDSNSDGCGKDT